MIKELSCRKYLCILNVNDVGKCINTVIHFKMLALACTVLLIEKLKYNFEQTRSLSADKACAYAYNNGNRLFINLYPATIFSGKCRLGLKSAAYIQVHFRLGACLKANNMHPDQTAPNGAV